MIQLEISVYRVGLIGFNRKDRLGECDKETSFKILDTFYEHGGNFIDT